MEDKLRAHMDHLFRDVPPTKKAVELKEEILQNLIDKYHDLIEEGKSPEAAYNIAVASIGDVSELVSSLQESAEAPDPMLSEEYRNWKKRYNVIIPVAVMLYILSVIPPIICDALSISDDIGACFLIAIVAIATALIVSINMAKPSVPKADATMMNEFKEWKSSKDKNKSLFKSLSGVLWSLILVAYFLISFATGAWHITWLIFLIGGSLESVMKAIFDLKK